MRFLQSEVMAYLPDNKTVTVWHGEPAHTVGAVFYAFKGPNLVSGVFGYHELFHAFVILGAGFHFAAVYNLIG